MHDRNRWTGTLAFGALGFMFGLFPAVGLAVTQGSVAAYVVGVMFPLFIGGLFAYAAWESYEDGRPIAHASISKRLAVLLIVGRLMLYPAFLIVAITFAGENVVLAVLLILVLVAAHVALSMVLSRRFGRKSPEASSS